MPRKKKGTELTSETEITTTPVPAAKPARTTKRAAATTQRKKAAETTPKPRATRRRTAQLPEALPVDAYVASGNGSNGNGAHPHPAVSESQVSDTVPVPEGVSLREQIALLAYTYWEARGYQGGSPEEDWLRAEREILNGSTSVLQEA